MKTTYRVTIERVETTIVEVEADNDEQAEVLAWQKWGANSYGFAETNITGIEEVTE
jgi:hypothetical protein